jgi:hypothetical protein
MVPATPLIPRQTPAHSLRLSLVAGQGPGQSDFNGILTRPLCPYPDPDAIYTSGNPNLAASYTCSSRPQYTNPVLLNGQRG